MFPVSSSLLQALTTPAYPICSRTLQIRSRVCDNRSWTRVTRPRFSPGGRPRHRVAPYAGKGDEDVICLDRRVSVFNPNISIYEFPKDFHMSLLAGSRALMLDQSGNIHSLYRPGWPVTGSYWDPLTAIGSFAPDGTIGIHGMGTGTVAGMIHRLFPDREMEGWELDPEVLAIGRTYMALADLEQAGRVRCHAGNSLTSVPSVAEGLAGLVVDLFADGALIPALLEVESWAGFQKQLMKGGRLISNLGDPDSRECSDALAAICTVFGGGVQVFRLETPDIRNMIVLTGPPLQDEDLAQVPAELAAFASGWVPYAAP